MSSPFYTGGSEYSGKSSPKSHSCYLVGRKRDHDANPRTEALLSALQTGETQRKGSVSGMKAGTCPLGLLCLREVVGRLPEQEREAALASDWS